MPTNTATNPFRVTKPLLLLLIMMIYSTILVLIIALTYSYNNISIIASGVGLLLLLAVDVFLWRYGRSTSKVANQAITLGMALGLLWVAEISVNNFIAPPLSTRDMIDNIFWATIAFSIFAYAIVCAYRTGHIKVGIEVGIWSGFVSGALACCMALSLIVFGMRLITQDPLNIAEWAMRGTASNAPTMAAYFAYETLAGAFLHLVVLGVLMGMLLGALGGIIGKAINVIGSWMKRTG